jgi:hypothetical protein
VTEEHPQSASVAETQGHRQQRTPAAEMEGHRQHPTPAKLDAEALAGQSWPYQHDISLVEDIDLVANTPGEDINWLEDIELLEEEGIPAVFDRYSNSFLRIYFPIPEGRENEIARKVLMAHLLAGNSYGIRLKREHAKFRQPMLGPWVDGSKVVGENWRPPTLPGWERPAGH